MKLTFYGAAQTVTGSQHLIEVNGLRILLDCGLYQGSRTDSNERNRNLPFSAKKVDVMVLSHAHIDHSGNIPTLVKSGFQGDILCTPATRDLCAVMLLDSAHIQEMEAQWKTRKRLRYGDNHTAPLYTRKDAEATFPLFSAVTYGKSFSPMEGLSVTFRDAGHILGAAILELVVAEDTGKTRVVFSGDLGRPEQLLVDDPAVIADADCLFVESTYGNRNHKNEKDSLDELAEAIAYSHARGEKVIIPAFAVERTQEIIYSLHLLARDGRLPKDTPVFVDSHLAIQATKIFRKYSDYLDAETKAFIAAGEDPLGLPQLRYSLSTAESMEINSITGPAIVISASGMANAGRIKHHLRHNLWRSGASIVFVGFQAEGTTGRKIVDGAKKVRIFNEEVAVMAKVFTINGFSAHAGQSQLLDWLGNFRLKGLRLFLIHGEYGAQQELARLIRERFGIEAAIPDYLEEVTLEAGREPERVEYPEKAAPRIDWDYIIADMDARLAQIKERRDRVAAKTWVEQTELRDRLLEVNRSIASIVSEI